MFRVSSAGRFALAVLLAGAAALPSSAGAAFPGENGRIAFVQGTAGSGVNIATMNPDGSNVLAVQSGTDPMWSPDGTKIAYHRSGEGLYVNADGTSPQNIAFVETSFGPAWSPDGQYVAYSGHPAVSLPHIYKRKLDGSGFQQLTGCEPENPDHGAGLNPAWSPTGQRIAYQGYGIVIDDGDARLGNLGPATVLATGCGEEGVGGTTWDADSNTYLDWSPDGSKIAFSGPASMFCPPAICHGTGPQDIWVVNADGTGAVNLTNSAAEDIEPAWSPSGTKIVFASTPSGQDREIYTMNADGTGVTQITNNSTADSSPNWQPVQRTYVRPRGATPLRVPLVPAYSACAAPNRTHGPPLSFGSCNPPQPGSSSLTIGSGDGSPAFARGSGFVRLDVLVGNFPPQDSDIVFRMQLTNVMRVSDLSEYTGSLRAELTVRLTDRNTNAFSTPTSTSVDFPFGLNAQCTGTPSSSLDASTCSAFTSANAIVPGSVRDGLRAIWALDKIRVYDGGPDENGSTPAGNQLFMTQGVFVP